MRWNPVNKLGDREAITVATYKRTGGGTDGRAEAGRRAQGRTSGDARPACGTPVQANQQADTGDKGNIFSASERLVQAHSRMRSALTSQSDAGSDVKQEIDTLPKHFDKITC